MGELAFKCRSLFFSLVIHLVLFIAVGLSYSKNTNYYRPTLFIELQQTIKKNNKLIPKRVTKQTIRLNSLAAVQSVETLQKIEKISPSVNPEASVIDLSDYFTKITEMIKNGLAESDRHQLKASGELVVRMTLFQSGEIESIQVEKTSGSARLDDFALKTVRELGPFPSIPPEVHEEKVVFRIPIQFKRF